MAQVHKQHSRDPNFPIEIIEKIEQFIGSHHPTAPPIGRGALGLTRE